MPKFLVEANYTANGIRGLAKDKASGRKAAIATAAKKLGGKLDSIHFCMGEHDVILILDMPDYITAAALSAAASAAGLARTTTTLLLTVDEMDKALALNPTYRAPGQ